MNDRLQSNRDEINRLVEIFNFGEERKIYLVKVIEELKFDKDEHIHIMVGCERVWCSYHKWSFEDTERLVQLGNKYQLSEDTIEQYIEIIHDIVDIVSIQNESVAIVSESVEGENHE